jgi:ribose transport system ATP-binding protein
VHRDGHARLRIEGLSKSFGGTRALIDVDLDVRADEVHALVGHNGSEKSTLIRALAGFHQPDPGCSAWFEDEPFEIGSDLEHGHDRLRFVHQDLGHIVELNVIDNLALRGAYVRGRLGRIRWAEQEAAARELLDRLGVRIDVHRPLAEATPVERVIVAIVAALQGWEGGRGVLVLDEPTAMLPPHQAEQLYQLIAEVRGTGASVLYVSHRMHEIFELADRVTVDLDAPGLVGIPLVPADRGRQGVIAELGVGHNLTLSSLDRLRQGRVISPRDGDEVHREVLHEHLRG